jgi:hypothetical protein
MPTMPTQRLALVMHTSVAVDDLLGITIMQLVHKPIDAGGRPVRLNALAPSDFDGAPVSPRRAAPIATNGDQLQHRDASRLGVYCHEDRPARRALTRSPAPIRRHTTTLWTSCGLSDIRRHGRCDRPRHHYDRSALGAGNGTWPPPCEISSAREPTCGSAAARAADARPGSDQVCSVEQARSTRVRVRPRNSPLETAAMRATLVG